LAAGSLNAASHSDDPQMGLAASWKVVAVPQMAQ